MQGCLQGTEKVFLMSGITPVTPGRGGGGPRGGNLTALGAGGSLCMLNFLEQNETFVLLHLVTMATSQGEG